MAVLSKKSKLILDLALASKAVSTAILANVAARTAVSAKNQAVLATALGSQLKAKTKVKSRVDEILAAVVSGAPLSVRAKTDIIITMADSTAGNELVNVIQAIPTKPIKI
jgi:hypothetical protein